MKKILLNKLPPPPNPIADVFRDRLGILYEESGTSYYGFSLASGIKVNTIKHWLQRADYRHPKRPSAQSLVTLNEHLGVSVDWLLGLSERRNA